MLAPALSYGGTRLKAYDFDDEQQIIDVQSYEEVSEQELERLAGSGHSLTSAHTAQPDPAVSAAEVMSDPERCFCRNCGQPVMKAASVCVNCHYVLNPKALQLGAQRIRERRAKYEKTHKLFGVIRDLTGVDLESDTSKALFEESPQNYVFRTTGAVYCTNCGRQVDEGASVCVHCKYVLNPAAVRRAQLALIDKKAKLTPGLCLKSLLIPGFGKKQRKLWAVRRPQIVKPCGILGKINAALIVGLIVLGFFLS